MATWSYAAAFATAMIFSSTALADSACVAPTALADRSYDVSPEQEKPKNTCLAR